MATSLIIARKCELFVACVALAKAQVLNDCLEGNLAKIEGEITSFAQLHDAVDANYYGGFCDDKLSGIMEEALREEDDAEDGMPNAYMDLVNEVQNAVDAWIREGGLCAACDHVEQGTLSAYTVSLAAQGLPFQLDL